MPYFFLFLLISCGEKQKSKYEDFREAWRTFPNIVSDTIDQNDIEKMKSFISQGFDVNSNLFKCSNPIIKATQASTEFMKFLIAEGANVNLKDCQGRTALYFVDSEKAKLLIENGADINIKDWINKNTPLHEALRIGPTKPKIDIDYIKVLVDSGADVKAVNKFGQSPLHYFKVRLNALKDKISTYKNMKNPKTHHLNLIKAYDFLKSQEQIIDNLLS